MMSAGREAIEKARLKGITDSKILSEIGEAAAESQRIINTLNNIGDFNSTSLKHILQGEINSTGKAVGFHYEGMPYSGGKVIPGTVEPANSFGVYRAKVEVEGIATTSHGGSSTFFPKNMNPQQVMASINEAFETKVFVSGTTYRGVARQAFCK